VIYATLNLLRDGCHGVRRTATLDLAPNGSLTVPSYEEQVEALLAAEEFSTAKFHHHCDGCSKKRLNVAEQKVRR